MARIHDYKQKHLMDDCSEALVKIKVGPPLPVHHQSVPATATLNPPQPRNPTRPRNPQPLQLAFRSGPVQVINPKASASQITLTDEPANFDEEKFIGDLECVPPLPTRRLVFSSPLTSPFAPRTPSLPFPRSALNEEDMGRHLGRVEDITMQEVRTPSSTLPLASTPTATSLPPSPRPPLSLPVQDYGIGEMMDDGGLAMDGFGEGSALPGLETEQLRAQPLTPEVNRDAGPDVSFDPYDDDVSGGVSVSIAGAASARSDLPPHLPAPVLNRRWRASTPRWAKRARQPTPGRRAGR